MPAAVMLIYSMEVGSRLMIGCYLVLLQIIRKFQTDRILLKLRVMYGLNEARQFKIKFLYFAFYTTIAVTKSFMFFV
jgi:hypothetical protein